METVMWRDRGWMCFSHAQKVLKSDMFVSITLGRKLKTDKTKNIHKRPTWSSGCEGWFPWWVSHEWTKPLEPGTFQTVFSIINASLLHLAKTTGFSSLKKLGYTIKQKQKPMFPVLAATGMGGWIITKISIAYSFRWFDWIYWIFSLPFQQMDSLT